MIHYPPINHIPNKTSLFLAGTIDMGSSDDWQSRLIVDLQDFDLDIYNPRRPDYDNTQIQSIDNPYFSNQVNWELNGLDTVDFIYFHFSEGSLSPISLMELGYCSNAKNPSSRIIVYCHPSFWRKGNIDILCGRKSIQVFDDYNQSINELRTRLK